MIIGKNVVKRYKTRKGYNTVLDDVSFVLEPGVNVGFLGRNGAGKSTLLRILGGAELPTSGTVTRVGTVSWPIGFAGSFQGSMTGFENLRFVCRVYAVDYREVMDFVLEFSELGDYLYMPVSSYSSGMRAKLAFGLSMAIKFNFYLIDEITAVGDAKFKYKCKYEFAKMKKYATLIIVSHNPQTISSYCDRVFVFDKGKIIKFDDVDKGLELYESL
ncbi:MAG: ABC transporter ATP-binding protein [Pseudodesulfovibrio sp.]|uniref:ATP-binding protein n=1 Tax=Pseudodesulfovibrio indicus TaxID=1716143 RepID=A0A126QMJ7_9BACT|nr:ABC transporter ATP-binding protein [Pseudodesulfovibrio indicus]AMK11037.1 ATP-binding protein [Pseudodesulfovibrio indicus]TDT92047.1 capsular polysaccharide transport system ATP-binding protein [Pseudodesulfovibrio indicus]